VVVSRGYLRSSAETAVYNLSLGAEDEKMAASRVCRPLCPALLSRPSFFIRHRTPQMF